MSASDADTGGLARVVRSLQLPLDPDKESQAADTARVILADLAVPDAEQPDAIASELESWRATGHAPRRFKRVVETLLKTCAEDVGVSFADDYFTAHQRLADKGELGFDGARRLLSCARLVAHLITHERMSCAQVARFLSAPLHGTSYNWVQIQTLAACLGLARPELTPQDAQAVFDSDSNEQLARFADSTVEIELERLVSASATLGFGGDAYAALKRFVRPIFDPGLTVLAHFMLTVCERYDHPPSIPYEFRPRGGAFKLLQNKNPQYAASGTASLNVAKAATALDDGWAWGRKGRRRGDALALVALFRGMEEMPYPARRELASWLRQWIVRKEERNADNIRYLAAVTTESDAVRILTALVAAPTRTYGTVEQRIVDALSSMIHPVTEWRDRGRKDSVFASNLSRKKMGDCEYMNRSRTSIVAYEAHAGILSETYVRDHCASLARVIEERHDYLEIRAPADLWDIEIRFVAHGWSGQRPQYRAEVEQYVIDITAVKYEDLLSEAISEQTNQGDTGEMPLVGAVNDNIILPLNERFVPQAVRDRMREIIEV